MKTIFSLFAVLAAAPLLATDADARKLPWKRSLKGEYVFYHAQTPEITAVSFEQRALVDREGAKAWFFLVRDVKKVTWAFWWPVAWDATNNRHIYEVHWMDRQKMFRKRTDQQNWEKLDCNLADLKEDRDSAYNQMHANANTDYAPYYNALYEQAKVYYDTCIGVQAAIRNGTYW